MESSSSSNKEIMKVRLLEISKVAPISSSSSSSMVSNELSLPLTCFDLPLLLMGPPEILFFYKLPNIQLSHFMDSLLPKLKHSLSLTLQHFYPLAGNLIWCPQFDQPVVRYVHGDAIPLMVIESNADFNHLTGYHPRDAKDFQHLIPQLTTLDGSTNSCNKESTKAKAIPVLALQLTLFPNSGICLGMTNLQAAFDGRAVAMFFKTWTSISQLGINTSIFSSDPSLVPSYDRTVIEDVDKGVRRRYWQRLVEFIRSKSMSEKDCNNWLLVSMDLNGPFDDDQVAATFVLTKKDIQRLRNLWASIAKLTNNTRSQQYPSRFELACAYVWICLAKIPNNEESTSIAFPADCRPRMDPPIPTTYFGNCIVGVEASAKRRDLVGENGIVVAVNTVMKAVRGIGGGEVVRKSEETLDLLIANANNGHRFDSISGSTQFWCYKTLDFGWGRPEKVEFMTKAKVNSIYFADCRSGDDGGVEISLVRSKGVENFRSMESISYDKKVSPRVGSKPFFAFIGEGFENVEELKHLKEVLLDLFCGSALHCAMRLKRSGTVVPKIELVEVGPSMDLVVRRHRLPNDSLRKEAMKTAADQPKKKVKNVSRDAIQGKIGKIYMPDQKVRVLIF
ncbi:hypothetical protein Scep_009251 [Stephania cephalantha]|uniref:Uncharacterized protein n=1 Tax=Stephania cephalantha TaxID=152367 RepID=A0AAP0PG34_9MAGN